MPIQFGTECEFGFLPNMPKRKKDCHLKDLGRKRQKRDKENVGLTRGNQFQIIINSFTTDSLAQPHFTSSAFVSSAKDTVAGHNEHVKSFTDLPQPLRAPWELDG